MTTLPKALHSFNAISIKYQWHFFMKLEQIISSMKTSVSSVRFSHSAMSNSLQPHESHHKRPQITKTVLTKSWRYLCSLISWSESESISHSIVSNSLQPCGLYVDCQAPLSMGFPRQEYWSGLQFLSPGDLPDLGIKPMSLASPASAGRFFTTSATWEASSQRTSPAKGKIRQSVHLSLIGAQGHASLSGIRKQMILVSREWFSCYLELPLGSLIFIPYRRNYEHKASLWLE